MMVKNTTNKPCSVDGCNSTLIARSRDWLCIYHLKIEYNKNSKRGIINWNKGNRKPIRRRSLKGVILDKKYSRIRKEFLSKKENQKCPVTNKQTIEIHHKMGKIGYADEWARLNDVPLLIDERFFLAVSRDGHNYIEANPTKAKEKGWSVKRIISL